MICIISATIKKMYCVFNYLIWKNWIGKIRSSF